MYVCKEINHSPTCYHWDWTKLAHLWRWPARPVSHTPTHIYYYYNVGVPLPGTKEMGPYISNPDISRSERLRLVTIGLLYLDQCHGLFPSKGSWRQPGLLPDHVGSKSDHWHSRATGIWEIQWDETDFIPTLAWNRLCGRRTACIEWKKIYLSFFRTIEDKDVMIVIPRWLAKS